MYSLVCTVTDFFKLNKEGAAVNFNASKRQLVIPAYQREFAWEAERINQLMVDINDKDKFLGILILDEKTSSYEIVDGQQRITSCYLILASIYNHFAGNVMQQELIDGLIRPYNHDFILKNKTVGSYISQKGEKLCISIENDIYNQKKAFDTAVDTINNFLKVFNIEQLIIFYKKLFDSTFLVIVNDTHIY